MAKLHSIAAAAVIWVTCATADPMIPTSPPSNGGAGSGTVTSVSVTTANGVSGTVATATTTPAISLALGAITPSEVTVGGTATAAPAAGSVVVTGVSSAPTLGANGEGVVWLTNASGLHLTGNGSSNDVVITNKAGGSVFSVPTGSTTSVLGGALSAPSLTIVGTIAGSICATSAVTLLYEVGATGCTISLLALKKDVRELDWQEAAADIMALKPISYAMKDRPDQQRLGFYAENTKEVDERFATYDGHGNLQAYEPNAILSAAVALLQKQQACLQSWKCRLFGWN
jgi:hypothetical protein